MSIEQGKYVFASASPASSGASSGAPIPLAGGGAEQIVVPGGTMLLDADFERSGADLLITGPDGTQFIIIDYFDSPVQAGLMTEGGSLLPYNLVSALAGPAAPGQYAQSEDGLEEAPIGRVDETVGEVTATRVDGTTVTLNKDSSVFQGDILETGSGGAVAVVFIDETEFSLGEEGRMVLDELIFDPSSLEGSSSFSVVQGVFVFVSGEIAANNPDEMVVRTPVATLGIRGTKVAGKAAAEGDLNTVTILPDPGQAAVTGAVTVSTQTSSITLNTAWQTTAVSSVFEAPAPAITVTASQAGTLYGAVNSLLSSTTPSTATNSDSARSARNQDANASGEQNTPAENENISAEATEESAQELTENVGVEEDLTPEDEILAEDELASIDPNAPENQLLEQGGELGPEGELAPGEGIGPDGFGPEGAGSQEFGPGEIGPEGVGPEGFGPEGFGPEGFGPEGFGPDQLFEAGGWGNNEFSEEVMVTAGLAAAEDAFHALENVFASGGSIDEAFIAADTAGNMAFNAYMGTAGTDMFDALVQYGPQAVFSDPSSIETFQVIEGQFNQIAENFGIDPAQFGPDGAFVQQDFFDGTAPPAGFEMDPAMLGDEFAGFEGAFVNNQGLQGEFGPEGFGPEGFGPEGFGPEGLGSEGFEPEGFGPVGLGPGEVGSGEFGSGGFGPGGFGPGGFGPGGFGLGGFGPGGFEPGGFGPGEFEPGEFGPIEFGPNQGGNQEENEQFFQQQQQQQNSSSALTSLKNGLGGTAGFGEQSLALSDNGSELVDISSVFSSGLNFGGGTAFTSVNINNNGNLTFGALQNTFTPPTSLSNNSLPIIAPFFADVDTTSGQVSPTANGTSTGSNQVHFDLDTANSTFTVTWDDVGFANGNTSLLNAFQVSLIDRGSGDFDVEFRYEDIRWTTGDNSGGTNGLGGTVARAGISTGSSNFVELAQSGIGTNGMLDLEVSPGANSSNNSGTWLFEIRTGSIEGFSLNGTDADDVLNGGSDGDTINGSNGDDVIEGKAGNDTLAGNFGQDTVNGGSGNDVIDGGDDGQTDSLDGGAGTDTITYQSAFGGVQVSLASQTAFVGGGTDIITNFENATGSSFSDIITGDSTDNSISGGNGTDQLSGGGGNDNIQGGNGTDIINGGTGDDVLIGGFGSDSLTGGDGRDTFQFENPLDGIFNPQNGQLQSPLFGFNNIADFSSSTDDKIKFDDSQSLFNLGGSFTSSNFFSINSAFDGTISGLSPSTPYVVVDSQKVVYYDDDVSTEGYTVMAVVTGDTPVIGDFQIG